MLSYVVGLLHRSQRQRLASRAVSPGSPRAVVVWGPLPPLRQLRAAAERLSGAIIMARPGARQAQGRQGATVAPPGGCRPLGDRAPRCRHSHGSAGASLRLRALGAFRSGPLRARFSCHRCNHVPKLQVASLRGSDSHRRYLGGSQAALCLSRSKAPAPMSIRRRLC